MLKLNRFLSVAVLMLTVFGLRAAGQFEVAPDHFPDGPSQDQPGPTAKALQPELKTQVAALQSTLDGYYAEINQQAEAVEKARALAAGAGGMGSFAFVFIEAYVHEYRQLEELKNRLVARIRLAQAAISALQQQVAESTAPPASTGQHKAKPAAVRAKAQQRQVKTMVASGPGSQ